MLSVPCWVNGCADDQISSLDRGLLYGDGVFETIAVINGQTRLLSRHFKRLQAACERLSIPLPIPLLEAEVERFLRICVQEDWTAKAILKIIVTRGMGGRGYAPFGAENPLRILQWHESPDYPEAYAQEGVAVVICKTRLARNPLLAGIKHLNRLEQVLARAEWQDPAIEEGLMFDTDDNLVDGTKSNVFLVSKGQLLTPDLSHCGVAGVMREQVIAVAKNIGIACASDKLSAATLEDADEVFLTNSVFGIWPVKKINQQVYTPGPVTKLLQTKLFACEENARTC